MLGEVCEFEYGSGLPERDRLKGSVPVFGSNGVVGYHNVAITQGSAIIIGRKGSIGQVNYSEVPSWPIDTTYYVDASKTSCDLHWLYWLLKWLRLDVLNKATGVPGLNRNDAYRQVIPLCPLLEQKRIAAKIQELMQEVERARVACEKHLEAAKALPAAYLRQVFESEEAKKWERKRLGEVLSVLETGSRPKGVVFEIKEGIPSIGAEHLNSLGGFNLNNIRFIPEEFYQTMKRGQIQKKDVLVVKDGATTGKVSFVDDNFPCGKAAINEHVFRLRGKTFLNQEFPFWFLYSPAGQSQIQQEFHGSAQGGINQKFVDGISIPLPSVPVQQRIASDLKEKMVEVEKLRTSIEKQLEAISVLPHAILRKAFKGEL